jgi:7-cyano-7-deazaguanine synthase in queuosine biosynthesis
MKALVICDNAKASPKFSSGSWEETIQVNHLGPNADLNLRIENISHAVLQDVGKRSADFVRIASYIYAADQSLSRGGPTDIYGKHWKRDLSFVIPVQDIAFWNQGETQNRLFDALSFLTEDNYAFEFTYLSNPNVQLVFNFENKESLYNCPDSTLMFSGGADSLCALVDLINRGKKPILVSHTPAPIHDSIQGKLVTLLRQQYSGWSFPHVSLWVHRKGSEAKESSQRSRSFLYLTLGAIVANQLGLKDVYLSDNGIVTLNLPKTPQVIGALASRSTHPRFVEKFQRLFDFAFPGSVKVTNPLLYSTRAGALTILKNNHCESLLQESVSCSSMRGRPKVSQHCGTCSQCVDRRFGSLAAGMQQYDLVERYGKDVFIDELNEGDQRTQVESYVRFALSIDGSSDEDLFKQYPQLYDCIVSDDPDPSGTAHKLVELLRRHSSEVLGVVKEQLQTHSTELLRGTLPESCLIRLVASGEHLRDPKNIYVAKLARMLNEELPKAFQSEDPKDEHQVQDVTESLLSAARAELDREVPLLPFAGISTKPDFSKQTKDATTDWLFVEMKYAKTKQRVNGIVTELTSRARIYQQQKAYALFCIYDPHGYLKKNQVITDLTKDSQKFMVVVVPF